MEDITGNIDSHCSGRIPSRTLAERVNARLEDREIEVEYSHGLVGST